MIVHTQLCHFSPKQYLKSLINVNIMMVGVETNRMVLENVQSHWMTHRFMHSKINHDITSMFLCKNFLLNKCLSI